MLVIQRPNETFRDWRARTRIAQSVVRHGLRVICLNCRAMTRHRRRTDGPLRDRACEGCGVVGRMKSCRAVTNGGFVS